MKIVKGNYECPLTPLMAKRVNDYIDYCHPEIDYTFSVEEIGDIYFGKDTEFSRTHSNLECYGVYQSVRDCIHDNMCRYSEDTDLTEIGLFFAV